MFSGIKREDLWGIRLFRKSRILIELAMDFRCKQGNRQIIITSTSKKEDTK